MKKQLTSSAKLQFSSRLSAFLVVSNEALVHPLVLLFHALDPQYRLLQSKWFAILQPGDSLDRVSSDVAGERGRSSKVDGLRVGFDLGGQRGGHGEDGLHALATDRVVHDAQILARILDASLADDQCTAHLTYALVQLNWLTT